MRQLLLIVLALSFSAAQAAEHIHIVIPGAAGGGWDRTARATGEALTDTSLVQRVSFENMSGGGGAKGIAHLIEVADPNMWLVNSTPIVVRSLLGVFPQNYRDLTPIASVIGDYSVIAVRQQSPIRNLDELAKIALADPRKMAIAGGSVTGGTDHIVAAMILAAYEVQPSAVKYIPYDAGGKAMGGLLSGEVQALSSGYGEVVDLVEQGYVRLLCITADQPIPARPDLPTCAQAGAKEAYFVNWRGFFTSKGTPKALVEHYRVLLQNMQSTPEWAALRDRYGWVDLHRSGPDFAHMLAQQEADLEVLLTSLGMM